MVKDLGPQWHRVVEEETGAPLVVPADGTYAIRGAGGYVDSELAWWSRGAEVHATITAILRVDGDGPAVWLERETGTVRRWSVVPPNEGPIAVLISNGVVERYESAECARPDLGEVAWMPWSDWLAFLAAPSVVEVREVTADNVLKAARGMRKDITVADLMINHDYRVSFAKMLSMQVNRARAATAPRSLAWLTGEAYWTAQWPKGSPWSQLGAETRHAVNAAAARLREIGGAQ